MATEFVDLKKYKISRYDEEKNKYFYYQEDFKWYFSYDLIINNKENKINKISKELICLRFEKATMTMLHEVGSYTKQFKTYDEFYDDIIKVIKIKQFM